MDRITIVLLIAFSLMSIISCKKKEKCQTCSHYQGGVAGGSITEERKVCDEIEATNLEASSRSINNNWSCKY